MSENNSVPRIGKLFIEFCVIVLGVFVAVAGESWWADREERAFERELRQDMIAEFADNINILENDLAINADIVVHIEGVTALSDSELLALSDDHLNSKYRQFIGWAGFDPEMGIVQALVESGNIGAIEDRDLRLRLSRWAGLLGEKQRYTLMGTDFQLHVLMDALARMSADRVWTVEERRRLQSLFDTLSFVHGLVVANQRRLLAEAQSIHDYLRTPSGAIAL